MAAHYTGDARLLRPGLRILDGATGTELERRGVSFALPLWLMHALLHARDVVREVHRDCAAAGAHALTANTFRTRVHVFARAGLASRAAEPCALAVRLARFVASRDLAPERFADEAARWAEAGAAWADGCCGTQPAHTAAVAARLANTSVRSNGRSAPE